ncbi:MAG TPA: fibronectin type III domain-containing protein, partial [Candidatus Thermoplasmatota archaeon]|nr:fibronectin type III domain-containing protein [Candidatus Thermoplasmatota archaeon]
IRIAQTQHAQLHHNAVMVEGNQTGFHFDDETSYLNVVPTTNTVNGGAVHWYLTLVGSEAEPVTLAGIRSETRGATNVAQVMLYRSSYVSLPDLVATNGTSRGVYLYRSSSVTIEGADLSNNTLAGADLHATQSSALRNVSAQRSGTGVRLTTSHSNVISGLDASGAGLGVHIAADSRDARVDGVEVTGAARGIRDDGWTSGTLIGNNLLADAGTVKRVKVGNAVTLADPTATYRHDSQRVVEQRWSWGDGTPDAVGGGAALLKPSHTYAAVGHYRAQLAVRTADGQTLRDTVLVEVLPPLSAPLDLVATPGERNATLRWSPPASDGALPVTSYRVYRGSDIASLAPIANVTGALSYADANLENGRVYVYGVAAVNAEGEGPRALAGAMPVGAPSAPLSLVATARPGAVGLAWQPPAAPSGLPLLGYVLLRAAGAAPLAPVAVLGNVTSHVDAGLTNGQNYTYAVRAYNALGNGTLSANATARPVGPAAAPTPLRGFTADAGALLVWTPPYENGGSPITGYRVWRAAENGTLAPVGPVLPANASTWRDAGLSNGRTYAYAVSAVTAYGDGARSALANVTPAALDTLAPILYAHEPPPGATLKESPAVLGARFVDNAGIALDSVRLYLDGALVGANVSEDGARYHVPTGLARGLHTLRLLVRDASGNEVDETWTFRVVGADELVPRLVQSGHALAPNPAAPGDNVTARLIVRNEGHAPGAAIVRVLRGNVTLAETAVELAEGAQEEVALVFAAPRAGTHALLVGDADLTLVVALPGEEPPATEGAAPPDETAQAPRRPVRSIPPPREEEAAPVPLPALLALAALAATAFCRRRR